MGRRSKKFGFAWSWKRASGLSAAKAKGGKGVRNHFRDRPVPEGGSKNHEKVPDTFRSPFGLQFRTAVNSVTGLEWSV